MFYSLIPTDISLPTAPVSDTPASTDPPLPTGLRLPTALIPSHYNVELWSRIYSDDPDYNDFGFSGFNEVWVTCKQSTKEIIIHIDQLTIDLSSLQVHVDDAGGTIQKIERTEEDKSRHFFKIYVLNELSAGQKYYIFMAFEGTHIHNDLLGYYRSSYVESGQTK